MFAISFFHRNRSVILDVALMLIVWVIDGVLGTYINLWIFYGFPIGFAAWNLGKKTGFFLICIVLVLLVLDVVIWGTPLQSFPQISLAIGSRVLAYCALVMLLGALRSREIERVYTPPQSRH